MYHICRCTRRLFGPEKHASKWGSRLVRRVHVQQTLPLSQEVTYLVVRPSRAPLLAWEQPNSSAEQLTVGNSREEAAILRCDHFFNV